MKGKIVFILICLSLLSCNNTNNKEIVASLYLIADSYPYNCHKEESEMEYPRRINFLFKIKNKSLQKIFIPLYTRKEYKYDSYILLYNGKKKIKPIVEMDWLNINNNELCPGDSIILSIRLVPYLLKQLGYKTNDSPAKILKSLKFKYIIDKRDTKLSDRLILLILFRKNNNVDNGYYDKLLHTLQQTDYDIKLDKRNKIIYSYVTWQRSDKMKNMDFFP